MGPPRLSVVTITYNDAAGLHLTVESLKPLFSVRPAPDWEHVVVDGSPPLSGPILNGLPAGWPLVYMERAPRGVPHAFNQAVAVARGAYVWFLNGGDSLRDPAVLSRMVGVLDDDDSADFICGGAYLCRNGVALYPTAPRHTLLGNILGRSWIYHQAVVYRRTSLARIGSFSTAYRTSADYDYHVRCFVAGLRGRFTADVLVNYDMGGGSNDVAMVFSELKHIQRSHRGELRPWVNWANEIVRTVEYVRILTLRKLSATPLGASLRVVWAKLNRSLRKRQGGSCQRS
jgi:glycosyltransferase involved in cell wall biosynthesis